MRTTPRVKPLYWLVHVYRGTETSVAETVLGRYAAWVAEGRAYVIVPGALARGEAGTVLEEAKAAAQADFTARILSALDIRGGGGPASADANEGGDDREPGVAAGAGSLSEGG